MITALLSSKEIGESVLKHIISKKLDSINNIQMAVGKNDEIIIYPIDYPSSINSTVRALSIADSFIFVLNEQVTALDGEIALALENSNLKNGAVLCFDYSDVNTFSKLFVNYKLGKSAIVKTGENIILKSTGREKIDISYISIDKHFIVKGIGNVLIGFNLGREIRKGEHLYLLPSMKEVTIKNIQLMDIDVQSAPTSSHVGLALNNATEEDMNNNYALSSLKEIADNFECKLSQTPLYKLDPIASKGLSTAILEKSLNVSLEKKGEKLIAKLSKPVIKLGGEQLLVDASLSVGKNRIVGKFEII
jgi:selenocysteine-specific translation elongation factor